MFSIKKDNLILFLFALFVGVKLTGELLNIDLTMLLIFTFVIGLSRFFFINKKRGKFVSNNYFMIFFIFTALMILSLSWTSAFEYGAKKVLILYSILFVFILFKKKFNEDYAYFILNFKYVYILIICFIVFFESNNFLMILSGSTIYRYRIIEGLNSNVISVFFAFSALCFFQSVYFTKSKIINIINIVFIFVSLIFLFLSGSRGAQVSFFGAIFIFYLITFVKNKKRILCYLLSISFLILIFSTNILYYLSGFFPSSLSSFFENRYISSNALESISARESLFFIAFDGYASSNYFIKLFFGNGIGSYGYLLSGIDERGYPHNIFLEILYELGLIPLILFLVLVIKIILKNFKEVFKSNLNQSDGMYLFFYFFLINALSTGDLAANFLLFIYMISLLMKTRTKKMSKLE